MYKVLIEKRAEKDLKALDKYAEEKIIERILLLKQNPRPTGSKKLSGSLGAWRIRFSDYRIIYEINDASREIKVYRIKHRSKAY